jgi:hypothetical protein
MDEKLVLTMALYSADSLGDVLVAMTVIKLVELMVEKMVS